LDQVIKRGQKLPGPSSYEPYPQQRKSVKGLKTDSPSRATIFDDLLRHQTRLNIPAAGKYDKIDLETKKDKARSGMGKSEVCSYLENSMRNSIELPGVGSYNVKAKRTEAGVPTWKASNAGKKRSESERGIKVPDVGAYHPLPGSYGLFDSMASQNSRKQKDYFGREQRFRSDRGKPVPFYNIASEWGKKDILNRVGSSVIHHSVYY
jgi:hypothetical protein